MFVLNANVFYLFFQIKNNPDNFHLCNVWFIITKLPILGLKRKCEEIFLMRCILLAAIFLGRVMVPSPKIVVNNSRTLEKLRCKGEPQRFRGQLDPSVQTNRQLLIYKGFHPTLFTFLEQQIMTNTKLRHTIQMTNDRPAYILPLVNYNVYLPIIGHLCCMTSIIIRHYMLLPFFGIVSLLFGWHRPCFFSLSSILVFKENEEFLNWKI